jgi:hypothetical protein
VGRQVKIKNENIMRKTHILILLVPTGAILLFEPLNILSEKSYNDERILVEEWINLDVAESNKEEVYHIASDKDFYDVISIIKKLDIAFEKIDVIGKTCEISVSESDVATIRSFIKNYKD